MKDIAKAIVYVGIFTIPAIVLLISNSLFFPFITGKNFAFRIIVEIIFAVWVILALYDVQYRPKFSWVVVSFSAFLVVMFFANLLGEHPLSSFWSNFERMEGYVTLVHTFLYMLVLGSVLTTQKLWDRYFITIISVAALLVVYSFAQLSGNIVINQGGGRLDGTLGNAAYMAIYTLFLIFITALMFTRAKSTAMRYVYGVLTLLFVYLLVQTETRGTALGLAAGSLIATTYIALFARTYPTVRKTALIVLATVILIAGTLVAFKDTSFVQNNAPLARITNITLKEAGNRFNIWGMAFEGVKERPLLGWGQSNYNYVFNKYYKPELHGQEAWFDRVHNIVMDWLIAGGLIGTIAYFSIIGSAFYYLFFRPMFRKDDEAFSVVERGVLLGLLSGYMVHNFVVFDNIVSYIFYGTILAYIHARVGLSIPKIEKWKIDNRIVEQVVTPIMGVLLLVVVYYVNVPGIQAAGDIIDGFRATDANVALEAFERALSRNSFGTQEIREQMMQRIQPSLRDPQLSEEFKQRAFKRIEEELLKQLEEKPGDARAHVFMSSFYRMTNLLDPAIEQLAIGRELSPQKQLIIYEQGMAMLQKQEYAKALEFFKQAYELGTQFTESRVLYAMSAVYAGELALVDELIQSESDKRAFANNELAIQAVYGAKMYPLLIEMFKIQVETKPQEERVRTSLAYLLDESGNTKEAIDVLRKAIEDIPTFKTQAEEFIATLEAKLQ